MKNSQSTLEVYAHDDTGHPDPHLIKVSNEGFADGEILDLNISIEKVGSNPSDKLQLTITKEEAIELAQFINYLYNEN